MEIADYIVAEDRRLVELVLEGDDTAFEYLFNRYRDAIHRLFVQRLGGVNDADDLLQVAKAVYEGAQAGTEAAKALRKG